MSTTAIVAELLVIGFLVLTMIFFLILSIFRIDNFTFLSNAKDFAALTVVVVTVLSYFLGALYNHLCHSGVANLITFLSPRLQSSPFKVLNKNKRIKQLISNVEKRTSQTPENQYLLLFILEHGSGELIERIKYMHSLARLFRSAASIVFLLGISLTIWLAIVFTNQKILMISITLTILLTTLSVVAACTIDPDFQNEKRTAFRIIQEKLYQSKSK